MTLARVSDANLYRSYVRRRLRKVAYRKTDEALRPVLRALGL